jgi:hypothetical protein
VTARICGAAQLRPVAPAVQAKTPASATRSVLRSRSAMASSGVVRIDSRSYPPKEH